MEEKDNLDLTPVNKGQFSFICFMFGVPEREIDDLYEVYLANISGDEYEINKKVKALNLRKHYRFLGREN